MVTKHEFTVHEHNFTVHGKECSFQTGKLAVQADGSIITTIKDNVLHIAAVMERHADADKDFMPLAIDVRDSYSAAGRIV